MLLTDLGKMDLQESERNSIIDDIRMAQEINGNPDENQQMLKRILLSNSRQSLMMFKALHRLDAEHMEKCPVQKQMKIVDGKEVFPWSKKEQSVNMIKIPVLGIQASGNSAMWLGLGFAIAIVIVSTTYLSTLTARNAIKEDLQLLKDTAAQVQMND